MKIKDLWKHLIGTELLIDGKKYYFGDFYAGSNFAVHRVCTDKKRTKCAGMLAKVFRIVGFVTGDDVEKELRYNRVAHALGVSPLTVGKACFDAEVGGKGEGEGKGEGKGGGGGGGDETERVCVIVFERFGRGSLTELVNSGRYLEHKRSIDLQLRGILDALYDAGINHNDTHSNNFLYDEVDGEIVMKIIDFDASQDMKPKTKRYYYIEIVEPTTDIEGIDLSGVGERGKPRRTKRRPRSRKRGGRPRRSRARSRRR